MEAGEFEVVSDDRAITGWAGGFTQMPNVVLRDASLSFGARMTYGILLSYAWYDAACFPSQARIGADLGADERSVRRYLAELRDAGLVAWRQHGMHEPNRYRLTAPMEDTSVRSMEDKSAGHGGHQCPPMEDTTVRSIPDTSVRLKNTHPKNTQKKNTYSGTEDSFDRFWAVYPRKLGRGTAERAWQKIPAETHAQIFAALQWQARSFDWTKDGGKYIPYPATYLNGKRWLDERAQGQGGGPGRRDLAATLGADL